MPFQEASLSEIGVFGDDRKTVLCGVLPNGRVGRLD
jgi:hypothetical protein